MPVQWQTDTPAAGKGAGCIKWDDASGAASNDTGDGPVGSAPRGVGPASPRAQALRETIVGPQSGVGQQQAYGTQADIEKRLRASGMNDQQIQSNPEWQQAARDVNRSVMASGTQTALGVAGAEVGNPAARLAGGQALKAVPKMAASASQFIKDVMPGAAGRVMDEVGKIGTVTDKSKLGSRVMQSLRPNYDAMHAERMKELERVAPAQKYIGAEPAEQAKLNAARVKVYNDPRFAELKKFETTPLGRKIVADTTKYSNVPRLDPKDLPSKVFRSAQSVRDLRDLLGTSMQHPQDAVESFAAEHAAQSLHEVTAGKDIKQAVSAAQQWMARNRDWLEQTPVTKAAVQHYVDRMKSVAGAQKVAHPIAKWVGTGLGIGAGIKGAQSLTE